MDKGLIHINQLAKKYKDSDYFAVNPLNLSIQKNEIFPPRVSNPDHHVEKHSRLFGK